jgi:hypothetical protein
MPTYAELHERLQMSLRVTQRDLVILEQRVQAKRARYGLAFDYANRRASLLGRIADLELNLEALGYEHAAQCAATGSTE